MTIKYKIKIKYWKTEIERKTTIKYHKSSSEMKFIEINTILNRNNILSTWE
jgi:hypothetical protein